jgi:hypothetical protein
MKRMWISVHLLIVCVLTGVTSSAENAKDDRLFRSEAASFEVRIPDGWHLQGVAPAIEAPVPARMEDDDFERAMRQIASEALVVATKHEEPYGRLNPSFQMLMRPLGPWEGKSGIEILSAVLSALGSQVPDFEVIDRPREIDVSGQPAARATARYTRMAQDGREYPTQVTMVIVARGNVVYKLGFTGAPEGPDLLTEEIDGTLRTVRFLD